ENGTFIPGTSLSFVGTKTGKVMSMGGSHVYKSSTYATQRALAREAAFAGRYIKAGGYLLGGLGIGLTLADMKVNGVTTSNSIDLIMGGVSMVPGWGWVAGSIYFIGNAALKAGTGMDLGEYFDSRKN